MWSNVARHSDPWSEGAIDVASVGDSQSDNNEFRIPDRVDDAIITDSDPPQICEPHKEPSAARSRVRTEGVDRCDDSPCNWLVELGQLLDRSGIVFNSERPDRAHSLSIRPTSSADTVATRPASRSARRSRAIRPSSLSIKASYRATSSAGTMAAARFWPRPRVTKVISPPKAARFTASEKWSRAWLTESSTSVLMCQLCAKCAKCAKQDIMNTRRRVSVTKFCTNGTLSVQFVHV